MRVSLPPRLFVLALLLLAIPAVLTAVLLSGGVRAAVRDGAQPGGVATGRLVGAAGEPLPPSIARLRVEVFAVDAEGASRRLGDVPVDEDGRFLLDLPACSGHYELRAGGDAWQPANQPFSLLGGGPAAEIRVPLQAAAQLDLSFERVDGRAVLGGRWTLDGDAGGSWFSTWKRARLERSGALEDGRVHVGGLPAMRAHVRVWLDGGERIDLVLDLAPGTNRHAVRL